MRTCVLLSEDAHASSGDIHAPWWSKTRLWPLAANNSRLSMSVFRYRAICPCMPFLRRILKNESPAKDSRTSSTMSLTQKITENSRTQLPFVRKDSVSNSRASSSNERCASFARVLALRTSTGTITTQFHSLSVFTFTSTSRFGSLPMRLASIGVGKQFVSTDIFHRRRMGLTAFQ